MFRARANSEQELPQLYSVPERPHSSYDSRPQPKASSLIEPALFDAMADVLGIPKENSQCFHWIVKDCLVKLKDEGWRAEIKSGLLSYVSNATEEIKALHPTVELYRQLMLRLLAEWREMQSNKSDRLYLARELVFTQARSTRDVRRAVSPRLVERLAEFLGVDLKLEPYLIPRIVLVFRDAYFAFKDNQTLTVHTIFNPETVLVELAILRIQFMANCSPTGLLYCVQCSSALADGICGSCHDALCHACFALAHATGHRLDHPFVFFEQCVCSECETRSAVVQCTDCADLFCTSCFTEVHPKGKHSVKLPLASYCMDCDTAEAAIICEECQDAMCINCSAKIHRHGARQNHHLIGLTHAAYAKRFSAGNLQTVMRIFQRNIEGTFKLSSWNLFYDDGMVPFWYNFATKDLIKCSKKDVLNPPAEPEDLNLVKDRCAKLAGQGAVFNVPPPVRIKFSLKETTLDRIPEITQKADRLVLQHPNS